MTDIKSIKDKILDFMDQEVDKYGGNRMDVKELGELADIVKDLAEAEYYCTVAQAMGGQESYGYQQPMGYGGQGGMRQGYGTSGMGHTDPIQMIRDALSKADPELRAMVRNELMR